MVKEELREAVKYYFADFVGCFDIFTTNVPSLVLLVSLVFMK